MNEVERLLNNLEKLMNIETGAKAELMKMQLKIIATEGPEVKTLIELNSMLEDEINYMAEN